MHTLCLYINDSQDKQPYWKCVLIKILKAYVYVIQYLGQLDLAFSNNMNKETMVHLQQLCGPANASSTLI